jgi:hypothetical protein
VEKDAMDAIARNGGQKRREWRMLVVEYEPGWPLSSWIWAYRFKRRETNGDGKK